MITVSILINGQPILTRSAYRTSGSDHEVCTYHCDDGSQITHNYDDGAVALAKKMLDTIKEKEEKRDKAIRTVADLLHKYSNWKE